MKKITKYETVEEIGKGGMGNVYKAFDPLMEREVAIKVLAEQLFDQPEIRERFWILIIDWIVDISHHEFLSCLLKNLKTNSVRLIAH